MQFDRQASLIKIHTEQMLSMYPATSILKLSAMLLSFTSQIEFSLI